MAEKDQVNKLDLIKTKFKIINGIECINLIHICHYFDMGELKHTLQRIRRNKDLFEGLYFEIKVHNDDASLRSEHYLSRDGVLMYISKISYKRHEGEKKDLILTLQRWLITTGGEVLDGKYIKEQDTLDWNTTRKKQIQGHHIMTNEITEHRIPLLSDPAKADFIYISYAKMIHRTVFGYHENGMRDTASTDEIMAIGSICEWIGTSLDLGQTDYYAHKQMVERRFKQYYPKLYNARELRLLDIEKQKLESETFKKLAEVD
jgi:hypothetical protein